ncbi:hypothetical protein OIU83_09520 [Flavobacterium sp. LS1R49]|uniref:1-phosphatidylinositol phosphodiesterase n=1 Tax=Flavobacterium shii TaxID=2987687 RepID=A0A9X2ZFL9_9FLAO|nr:phosphatidylinositol-specific phospholipase C domain-containing protein [Flavobacterium shii]MCV9927891.1 hypothetical protein [Flavobacterium shii]
MTRRMTITVVNTNVDEKWIRDADHLEHGKWMDGGPPASISQNGKTIVKSEKQTGAAYGTTGWIRFVSNTHPGSTMTITWNKPYGKDATTCIVDMNSVKYTAKVENKDFQTSEAWCDVVISVNQTPVIDTKNWMSKIPKTTTIDNIIMPGSHDAGMSELHHCSIGATDSNTQTQQLDIKGQLEAGSRYFDIRVDYDHNELITYHRIEVIGLGCSGQLLKTVLNQATEFLKHNKTETAILKFSHIRDNSEDTKKRINDMLLSSEFKDHLYKSSDVNLAKIKLGDAAEKIIVVFDYNEGVDPAKGFFRFHDGFVDKVCSFRGKNVTVCDLYSKTDSYSEMAADQIAKWDKYAGFGKDYLFLLSWTLTAGAGGSIRDLARVANENLPNVLANQITVLKKGKPNIVYIDFVNVATTRAIIAYNF